jgi:hypothetical protein
LLSASEALTKLLPLADRDPAPAPRAGEDATQKLKEMIDKWCRANPESLETQNIMLHRGNVKLREKLDGVNEELRLFRVKAEREAKERPVYQYADDPDSAPLEAAPGLETFQGVGSLGAIEGTPASSTTRSSEGAPLSKGAPGGGPVAPAVTSETAPAAQAERHPPPGWTNGLADVPAHVRDSRPAVEPWRPWIDSNGEIRQVSPSGKWWGPI